MSFVRVVGHGAGLYAADVSEGIGFGEEVGEVQAVAIFVGAALAPGYGVAEGEDAEGDSGGDCVSGVKGMV